MESSTQKMEYYDRLKSIVDFTSCPKDEVYSAKLILINEVISNDELTEMDTKDLLAAIVEEL